MRLTPTRLLATSALALASASPMMLSMPAATAASQPAYTETAITFTVTGIPDETTGQGTQDCTIVADLFKPTVATAKHRVPVILATNGFGGSKADQDYFGPVLAEHGYALLSYSGLGFGGSGCRISLDDRQHDGLAGSQLVSWLGGDSKIQATVNGAPIKAPNWIIHDRTDHNGHHRRYDPRVGMIGGSYGGQIQFAVAGSDPRVDTIVPIITWNDLSYSLAPNNLVSPGGFTTGVTASQTAPGTEKMDWVSLFFGVGIVDGLQGMQVDPTRDVGCPNFIQEACVAKANLDTLGYPNATTTAFAYNASVASYIKNIKIPVLLAQGQADTLFNLQEAIATYQQLRAQHTPVKMIWQSWGHSDSTPAKGEFAQDASVFSTYEGQRFLAWFDHYLKHKRVGTGPNIAYYRDWVPFTGTGPDTVQFGRASQYPIGRSESLWLSGSNALVSSPDAVQPGSATYSNVGGGVPTSYSETSAAQGSYIPDSSTPPSDAPGTFAAFSSAPLTSNVDVVGVPTVTVSLACPTCSSTDPDTELQLFAKIYDVAPDGTVTLVHRLVAPVRVPDLSQPVTIELPGIVHRFAAGDTIELVLAATDAAYRNADVVQPVTVTTDPSSPGVLSLPVVD